MAPKAPKYLLSSSLEKKCLLTLALGPYYDFSKVLFLLIIFLF